MRETFRPPSISTCLVLVFLFLFFSRYLWKHARPGRGGIGREWQKRYFVLSSDRVLYYYISHADKNPRAIIPLEGLEVLKVEHESRPFCFLIRDPYRPTVKAAKRRDDGSLDTATHENFLLSAESEADQNGWIKSLRLNIDRNPFYTLIKTKVSALHLNDAASSVGAAVLHSSASARPPSPTKRQSTDGTPRKGSFSGASGSASTSTPSRGARRSQSFAEEEQDLFSIDRPTHGMATDLESTVSYDDESDTEDLPVRSAADTPRLGKLSQALEVGSTTTATASPSKASPHKAQPSDSAVQLLDQSSDSEIENLDNMGL